MPNGEQNEGWDELEGNEWWTPENIGDCIEGTVSEVGEGDYGLFVILKTVDGDLGTPSHKNLQAALRKANVGDFIRICLTDRKDVGRESLKQIYRVFKRKTKPSSPGIPE